MARCGFAIAILLVACSNDSEGPIPGAAPARRPSASPTSVPTSTETPPTTTDAGTTVTVRTVVMNRDESCVTLATRDSASLCWRNTNKPIPSDAFFQIGLRFENAVGNGDWFLGRTANSTYVWGSGALGSDGNPNANAAGAALVFPGSKSFGYASAGGAAGGRHGCALSSQSSLYCWGDDSSCQVSAEATCAPQVRGMTDRSKVAGPSTFVTAVAAGAAHTCVVAATGTGATANVYCWGANTAGETGQPVAPTATPAAIPFPAPALSNELSIASGDHHACAIVRGELFCWGKNDRQQASISSSEPVIAPAKVELGDILGKVSRLALSANRTCFVVTSLTGRQPSRAFCLSGTRLREVPALEDIAELAVSDTNGCAIARLRDAPPRVAELFCWAGDAAPERVVFTR